MTTERGELTVEIKLTFSPEDADVIDLVAKVLKKTRDEVVAEILVSPARRHMAGVIGELRLALLDVDREQIDASYRLRRKLWK